MANGTDFLKQLTGTVLPAFSSLAANRLLRTRSPALRTLGTVGVPLLTNAFQSFLGLPSLTLPSLTSGLSSLTGLNRDQLLGGGLLLGSTLADQEPGSVTEARQFLRNRFTSPTALSEQFGHQISGLAGQFQPLLTQQRERGLSDIQARFVKAFPASVGAQPTEFTALGRYLTEQALPREQGLLGDLGLNLLGAQERAATSLLNERTQNQLAAALGQLGGLMLLRNANGNQQVVNIGDISATGGTGGAAQGTPRVAGAGPLMTQSAIQQALARAIQTGHPFDLSSLAPIVSGLGGPDLSQGVVFQSPTGELALVSPDEAQGLSARGIGSILGSPSQGIPWVLPNGTRTVVSVQEAQALAANGIGQPAGAAGLAGGESPFAVRGLGGGLGAIGSGVGGFFAGREIGGRVGAANNSQALGALSGAATGAAIGSVVPGIGTAIGAILGGLSGLFGGFGATRANQQAVKAEFLRQDMDSQRDQVFEEGNIGSTFLQRFGVDQAGMDSWTSEVNRLAEESASPAAEQDLLAESLNRRLTALLGGPPSQKAPQLRQEYIDYLVSNTFSAGNSSFGGGAPRDLIEIWATKAGLRHGGVTTRRIHLVGEAGPELLLSKPGTAMVVPLWSGRN